ncbi:MAG: hypothetical protein Q9217_001238 [Psora testacea]
MSSSQPFLTSSQISPSKGRRRKSKFTYKQLTLLGQSSIACPLRVIAHIDLDAFYAQCEGVRLGIAEDQPLAVQQWQGLIAINYPARKYGLSRHITITEAKKLCPQLVVQHVATWKEGDEKWAYHEDAFAHIGTHKVSLDPYRLESRRILACIKETLPAPPLQRVEKASVDEVFIDLSAQIHSILLERYPEISGPAPYDDPTEMLPRPPTTALDWDTDALVDLDESETEDDDPDWDDIAMLIGSEIVRGVRAAIKERLKYTCSAGIARNKMMAKLGSAHKKPNQQTIVRNRAAQHFLGGFKFTKIRNLGGKLGDEVVAQFATDQVKDLQGVPIEQLKLKLGDDTGSWVYHIIRGEDSSEVNARTQIKSMLSAKSFRPTINSSEQAIRWLRIFAADIYSRLVEEGVLENKRRPKTINLHHRQGAQMKSRQASIPTGRPIDEALLFNIAKNLLGHVVVDGRAWPCSTLQLSVGGFEEGPTGNRGIGGFLLRGDEAKAMTVSRGDDIRSTSPGQDIQPAKRRKLSNGALPGLFARQNTSHDESGDSSDIVDDSTGFVDTFLSSREADKGLPDGDAAEPIPATDDKSQREGLQLQNGGSVKGPYLQPKKQPLIESYFCDRCKSSLPTVERGEHEDWHFAKDLLAEERAPPDRRHIKLRLLPNTVTEVTLVLELAEPESSNLYSRELVSDQSLPVDPKNRFFRVADRLRVSTRKDPLRIIYPPYVQNALWPKVWESDIQKEEDITGSAFRVKRAGEKTSYIYKIVDRPFYNRKDTYVFLQELQNLKLFRDDPNIVQLRGIVVSTNPYQTLPKDDDLPLIRGFLLKYHPYGALEQRLEQADLANFAWKHWPLQIGYGLLRLHQENITHMDLKPSNIVIGIRGNALLIDISGIGGVTLEWMAPEVQNKDYREVSPEEQKLNDVWPYGRVLSAIARSFDWSEDVGWLHKVATDITQDNPHTRIDLPHAISRLQRSGKDQGFG